MWNEEKEREFLDIFRAMLRINSSNPPGDERAMADYIAAKLKSAGIEPLIAEKAPGRANVLARLKGADSSKKALMLISHIDVVPAEGWTVPAFEALERDGVIYGRGALDTKQLTAAQLMAMLELARSGVTPSRDVIFIASADEENGSAFGMEYLREHYPDWFPPAYVWSEGGGFIVNDGERLFRLCAGSEKSTLCVQIDVERGRGGSELPEQTLYRVMGVLEALAAYDPPTTLTAATARFRAVVDPESVRDATIKNLWEYSTKCSMQLDKFDLRMAPDAQDVDAGLTVSFKLLPGMERCEAEAIFERALSGLPVKWSVLSFQQGYESRFDNEFIDAVERVSSRLDPGTDMLPMLILGCTDGRFIGGDVYGYTPVLSDTPFSAVLQMVHGQDECLSVASAAYCGRVITETVCEFAI